MKTSGMMSGILHFPPRAVAVSPGPRAKRHSLLFGDGGKNVQGAPTLIGERPGKKITSERSEKSRGSGPLRGRQKKIRGFAFIQNSMVCLPLACGGGE